jgi:hypothetical protein
VKRFKIMGMAPYRADTVERAAPAAASLANVYGRPVFVEDRKTGTLIQVDPRGIGGGDGAEGLVLPVTLQHYEGMIEEEVKGA